MFLIKKEKRTLRPNNPFYRARVKLFNTSPGLVSYLETCRMREKKLMAFLKSTAGRWSQGISLEEESTCRGESTASPRPSSNTWSSKYLLLYGNLFCFACYLQEQGGPCSNTWRIYHCLLTEPSDSTKKLNRLQVSKGNHKISTVIIYCITSKQTLAAQADK